MGVTFQSGPAAVAAVTISPAAGAALAPPYPAFSMMMAKAIRLVAGPYGAKPTNHPCEGAFDTSAVPVLPAIRPGMVPQAAAGAGQDHVAHVAGEHARAVAASRNRSVARLRHSVLLACASREARRRTRSPPPRAPSAAASRRHRPGRSRSAEACRARAAAHRPCRGVSGIPRRPAVPTSGSGPSLTASCAKYALHEWTKPSCMSIVPCGCVSSTSSRTGRFQPGDLAPTRPSGSRAQVNVAAPDRVLPQRRRGRHQLERRSRRIQAVARAIEQASSRRIRSPAGREPRPMLSATDS